VFPIHHKHVKHSSDEFTFVKVGKTYLVAVHLCNQTCSGVNGYEFGGKGDRRRTFEEYDYN